MKDTSSYEYSNLEKEHSQLKQALFTKLFQYILIGNVVFIIAELLRAIITVEIDNFVNSFVVLLFTVIYYKFIRKQKEKLELGITAYMTLFYVAGIIMKCHQQTGLFNNPLDSFYFAYIFCLFDRIVVARVPTLRYRIIYTLFTTIIRVLVVPANDKGLLIVQLVYVFFAIYLDVDKENSDQNLFQSYFNSKNQLEKFKNLVVNDIPEGIVIISQDLTQNLFANKAFSVLSDFESNPDIRTHLNQFRIYEQEDESQNAESLIRLPSHKTLLSFLQTTILDADFLSNKRYSCNVSYSRNNSILEVKIFYIVWDEIPAVAVILHDITQQHTIISLKTASDQKDALLATVSHELRTPLNGMIGMIQVLQKRTQDPESMRYLNICKNSGNLLMGLVNSILDFNQIRAKKFKLNPERINLVELLKDIVQLFDLQCIQKKISLKLNVSLPTQKYVMTDPNRLTQIFINLVGNALKFTMKGGIIMSVKESSDGKHVQLAVEDTGIGIKDEDKGKLFRMFGKLEHGDSQTNKQGVGLGLTISDNLARLLCGEDTRGGINLTSSFGVGSVFSFWIKSQLVEGHQRNHDSLPTVAGDEETDINERMIEYTTFQKKVPVFEKFKTFTNLQDLSLPNSPQAQCEKRPQSSKLSNTKSGMYVLIVDDNPFNITVAEYFIKSHGYKTKIALSGQTAIDLLLSNDDSAEPIKIIFMDCLMPIMNGYELTKVLKKLMKERRLPEIPIIALTANNSETDKEACIKAGMSGHLTKPLKEADLYKILNKYIE